MITSLLLCFSGGLIRSGGRGCETKHLLLAHSCEVSIYKEEGKPSIHRLYVVLIPLWWVAGPTT